LLRSDGPGSAARQKTNKDALAYRFGRRRRARPGMTLGDYQILITFHKGAGSVSPTAESNEADGVDYAALVELNRDYISSVQNQDVQRFDEILAAEFYCSNPDGSLVDRAGFLRQTAQPVTISNLKSEDVMIRILGDAAIIHGRTTYTKADGS